MSSPVTSPGSLVVTGGRVISPAPSLHSNGRVGEQ